jgi:hypothetical protein
MAWGVFFSVLCVTTMINYVVARILSQYLMWRVWRPESVKKD